MTRAEVDAMALRLLSHGPDRITLIEGENTLAAALLYADLQKRGLVTIENDDNTMLVTITPTGLASLDEAA